MSSGTGPRRGVTAEDVAEFARRYYVHATLGVLMLFMFWVRVRRMDRFTGRDPLQWQAVDSYYHWRTTEWTVRNYPFTMPYEVFTGFPSGRYVGQFGTLFDQVIATLALVIGLGSPGDAEILLAGLIGVPAIAAAVAIPVFLIGRRLAGDVPALVGVAILALTPGEFLSRSVTGMFQHHAAEALAMAVAVLAMMVALRVAEVEQPVWELVLDRDWAALRRPAAYSVAAGVALGTYAWVWPPAIVLFGIFGVFFVVAIVVDHVRGSSPEPLVFVGAVSFATAGLMTLLLLEDTGMTSPTSMDLLNPIAGVLIVVGCVTLGVLSRQWHARGLDPLHYPAAVAGIGAVGIVLLWLVLPDVLSTMLSNFTRRLLPLSPDVGTLTIAEARPPSDPARFLFEQVGFAFYTMIIGLGAILARPFLGQSYRSEHTLVVVWSLFLISMALTQIRFSYYLVLAVAVVNAYLVALVIDVIDLPAVESVRDVGGYQVLTLVLVVMLLFVPLLPPVASVTAFDVGDRANPSTDALTWESSNLYLAEHTPEVGDWGEHANADELDHFGRYSHPGSAGFDYPDGSYGVMSWWDYGHLITTHAERIPHANPFQQNARSAAHYLLSMNETQAELHLDAIEASGGGVNTNDVDELRAIVDAHEGELTGEMRYVMIDDQMAAFNPGKMQAITQWTDLGIGDFIVEQQVREVDPFSLMEFGEPFVAAGMSEAFHDTMIARLYFGDASGLEHYRLIHESEQEMIFGSMAFRGDAVFFNARLLVPMGALGGLSPLQFAFQQQEAQLYDVQRAAQIKTFERVAGATLTGTAADPEASIVAEIDVTTNQERNFTYRQVVEPDADGTFAVTVPYASAFDRDVADGYTESAVETGEHVIVSEIPDLDDALLEEADATGERVADLAGEGVTRLDLVTVTETDIYEGHELAVDLTERPAFEVTSVTAPETVAVNETFEVTAEITNLGDTADAQPVTLAVDDAPVDEVRLALEGGATDTVTFEHVFEEAVNATLTVSTFADAVSVDVSAVAADDDADDDTTEAHRPPARVGPA